MAELRSNRSFRNLLAGRIVTDFGDSLYYIAGMWLVWELSGSTFYTGLAGALIQLPNSLGFLNGPLVDRWGIRRLLVSVQIINGVGVLAVPIAAITGHLSVWVVVTVMPVLAYFNNFVYPAQNAALPHIVDDEHLTRANSLFATSYKVVDTASNAIAGVLITVFGAVTIFLANSVSFALAGLLFARVVVSTAAEPENEDGRMKDESNMSAISAYLTELREGIGYVRGSSIVTITVGTMLTNLAGAAALAVLPAYADFIGGPETYGILMAALAGGVLVGAWAANIVNDYPFGLVAILGFPVAGTCWLAAVAIPGLAPTAVLFFFAEIPAGVFNVLLFSMLQSAVDNSLLGRVTSLTRSLSTTMVPIGMLLGGTVAGIIGPVNVMYGVGSSWIVLGLYFALHPGLRSIPPVTDADDVALGLSPPGKLDDAIAESVDANS